ncbi:tetratricopeptide repeat protein [Granulicella sibirica]|uniref:TPR domain protein, putative component of TonB system n=1 Tax=Granulicella sibirica TaxID=2479048 RepID=A0A4Q0T056_9BACT|nr:tetratricopeptide repeat protein [Granulicella sibirica]RXH56963.1 TPR domain protein, putative component of TonB system [Granulicella sibirica]
MTLSFLRSSAPRILRSTRLLPAAAALLAAHAVMAQVGPRNEKNPVTVSETTKAPDRATSYYHYGLAHLYEEMAVNAGRPDYATQAIEQYKLALDADPSSTLLQDGLGDLYFRLGRIREAVQAAQEQVTRNPDDLAAHELLGKVYVRSLGDMQGAQAADMLKLAIAEYEKLAELKPNDVETKLLLGQLYGVNHDSVKAEKEFRAAQGIDSNSEEVVLNMARLYTEEGSPQRAVDALMAVPETDRTERMEYALGASYDQLKDPRQAAAAYRRALDMEPDNLDAERGLANALLLDGQLDEAMKTLQAILTAEPQDVQSQIHISEVQRRQGHYKESLATLEKAKSLAPDNPELNYNEALLYDSLGQYPEATGVLEKLLAASSHPDGNYSEQEKGNRYLFLDRLGSIYKEEDKTPEAIAAYKQVVALGGDFTVRGYQGEVDTYRDAHQFKEATAVGAEAAKAFPKDKNVQLMYAQQLTDTGKIDEGLALAKAQLTGATDDRDVHLALGQMLIRLRQYKEANAELDIASASATRPEEKRYVTFLRGELYDRAKEFDLAEAEFRKALATDPKDPTILNYLGYMLADRGEKLPEALEMIKTAVELDPQNYAYLDSLGWVYFKLGQNTLAEQNLHKAIERSSADATVHDHLGQVYEKTGRLKLAVTQWERAMTEFAQSLPADSDPADVEKVRHQLEGARTKLAHAEVSGKPVK